MLSLIFKTRRTNLTGQDYAKEAVSAKAAHKRFILYHGWHEASHQLKAHAVAEVAR
jgi:hypothetical protein